MFEVSVIIPVYNAEKFLKTAIESALSQSEVTEIILVEDRSPDKCLKICLEYTTIYDNIKVLTHPNNENRGAAESRNLGIINAKNKFIAFLDADDYYLPFRFRNDVQIFKENNKADGVYNAIEPYAFDENGQKRLNNRKQYLTTLSEIIDPANLFFHMSPIGNKGHFSLNGLTVKKKCLLGVGLLNKNLILSQDTDLCIKLAAKYNLYPGLLYNPVARFSLHSCNRSQLNEKILNGRPYLFKSLYKWALKERLAEEKWQILWRKYYEFYSSVHKPSKLKQKIILFKELFLNIRLVKYPFYRHNLIHK